MISVANLAADLKLSSAAQTADTTYLTDLELSAVAFIERATGRYFGAAAATTEYVIGDGTSTLWLAEAPTTIPVTVTERADPGSTSSTTITAANSDGYTLRGMRLIRKGYVWTRGFEYAVTYSRGYAADSEPEDIQRAVRGLVVLWYEKRVEVADVGVNAPANLIPHGVTDIIASWKRRPF